jgi:NADP-dependent 3-hydroxy acid dehydrogenase YdfG
MEGLLKGRLALVTGAGSGIGEGIADAMATAAPVSLPSTSTAGLQSAPPRQSAAMRGASLVT